MAKYSAGILAFRKNDSKPEVLLVHPGGPFFTRKDLGVWSVPKGEYEAHEDPLTVALREFEEETGNSILADTFIELGAVKLKSGKTVTGWAVEANFDRCFIASNTFEMEWPPKSGKKQVFPEVDRAEWFTIPLAIEKINPAQVPLLKELEIKLEELK